jgi:phosphohistidine phosphatase SixA
MGGGDQVMRVIRFVLVGTAIAFWSLAFWSFPVLGQSSPPPSEWINALRAGGHVIVMRHGTTYPDQADTEPLNFGNVEKQRQLNDAGRAAAKEMGGAFAKLQIPIAEVYTSMFNRAIETAWLAFGEATPTLDLTEGGLVVTPIENNRRAQALRKLVATAPPAGTNTFAVTHKPNILDAFGKDWFDVREGEASVFKPDGNGGYKVVVRVQADEWSRIAANNSR